MPYSRVKRWVAIAAVNLAVILITAEVLGSAHYYYQNDSLFYRHRPHYELIRNAEQNTITKRRLHPFFLQDHRYQRDDIY